MIVQAAAYTPTFAFTDRDKLRCKLPSVMRKRSSYLELLVSSEQGARHATYSRCA